ncbi:MULTISPECIES: hypothetical protein [unclassified Photobacterium]|uniref:hypothetical protein n=1 Tax=unclassified Photobacterium TaxID=2628852 RepID=UPI000D15CDCA|nr:MULTISPECIES: hypothetical protein [unclassified Photobacterium]PSV38494.1 hypothetical protein C9J38_08440 [Photobacterium sp. GB-210]PSV41434.1 hypothetical protein C9J46_18305 [Photobacterium sp. GB-36]PSV50222.1 hypothetical protein C9J45_21055 [Photobacterium sp. GB-1]PSV56822.1 hypothetical protein C9J43_10315 [Photobacterium sp. GB-3]
MIKIKGIMLFLIVTSTFNVYANDIDVFVNPGRDVVVPVVLDGITLNNQLVNSEFFWAHERVGTSDEYSRSETRGNITLSMVGTASTFRLLFNGGGTNWNCNLGGNPLPGAFPGHNLAGNILHRFCGGGSQRLGFHLRNRVLRNNWRVNLRTRVNQVRIVVPANATTQQERFSIFHRVQRNNADRPINVGTADRITVHIIQNTCTFGANNADIDINVGDITPGIDGPRTPVDLDLTCISENNEVGTAVNAGLSNTENTMLANYRIEENIASNFNDKAVNVFLFRPNNVRVNLGQVYDDIFELNNLEYQVIPSPIDEFDPHDNTAAQFGAFTRSYNVIIDYF